MVHFLIILVVIVDCILLHYNKEKEDVPETACEQDGNSLENGTRKLVYILTYECDAKVLAKHQEKDDVRCPTWQTPLKEGRMLLRLISQKIAAIFLIFSRRFMNDLSCLAFCML